jgi:hypothetical protein
MDTFDEPYWNLNQVYIWALTRDPKLVARAAASELEKFKNVARLSSELSAEYYLRISGPHLSEAVKRLEYVATHGKPPDVPSEDGQPEWPDNVLPLFRSGTLKAWANLPGDPRAYEISKADWAGLEIVPSGSSHGLIVWRIGNRRPGAKGDFEDIRVERESVLKVFPADATERVPETGKRSAPHSENSTAKPKLTKRQAVAEALKELFPNGSSRTDKELCQLLQERIEIGAVSESTVKRAISDLRRTAGSNRVK